jgi:translation initiation factor 2 subunit 1
MVKRKGFPTEGEVVLVTAKYITPYSALCSLDEYPGKEGMIHVSEVSGRWVRDIKNFVKKGKQYIAKVTRVDKEKGHINLSLKRVPKKSKERKLQEYKQEERAEKMLELLGEKLGWNLEKSYEKLGYEFQDIFGTMFQAFSLSVEDPEQVVRRGIEKKYVKLMQKIAKEKIQKKEVDIKATLELKYFTGDGVERVKEFLSCLTNKYGWEIKYISAPKYSIEIRTEDPKSAERELRTNLEKEVSKIENGTASFKIGGD